MIDVPVPVYGRMGGWGRGRGKFGTPPNPA